MSDSGEPERPEVYYRLCREVNWQDEVLKLLEDTKLIKTRRARQQLSDIGGIELCDLQELSTSSSSNFSRYCEDNLGIAVTKFYESPAPSSRFKLLIQLEFKGAKVASII